MRIRTVVAAVVTAAIATVPYAAQPAGAAGTCLGVTDAMSDASLVLVSPMRTSWFQLGQSEPAADLTKVTLNPDSFVVRFHVASLQTTRPGSDHATAQWAARFRAGTDRYRVRASADAPVVNTGDWRGGGYHVWRNGHELAGVVARLDATRAVVVVDAPDVLTGPVRSIAAESASTVVFTGSSGSSHFDLHFADTAGGLLDATTC